MERLYWSKQKKDGKINLFEDDHVKKIAQFPTIAFLDQGAAISFADGPRQGEVGLGTMSILKNHYGDLISVIPREYYVTHDHCGRWNLHINSIVWFDPKMDFHALSQDAVYYMKESQWFVKKCAAYGFAAKGGSNGEPHNDLGNFILCSRSQRSYRRRTRTVQRNRILGKDGI